MAEKKECEKSQNIVDEASEKEKKESLNQEPEVSEETGCEEGGEEGEADEAARLSAELETLKATIEKMQKDYLLLMAEFDNFRKRTLREKSELIKNGGENCIRAVSMHLNGGKLQLPAEEESCYVVLVAESGCTLQYAEQTMLLNPGSALLLGPGGGCIQQTGSAAPELVGCSFPLSALHELRTQTQRDFSRLFEPEQSAVLYGSVQWNSRLRTLLELMRTAMEEPDYPGALYLLLVLHYIEQECIAESSAVARPHNKTVEHICAYLAANYRQKFSLSEVAARFYLSPYYLSRLFKRVTGQSIVDYINNRRIEAAQKLLETTELSISAVAEQTGFASAAHFRRVFHEVMGTGPLQYRKAHKK